MKNEKNALTERVRPARTLLSRFVVNSLWFAALSGGVVNAATEFHPTAAVDVVWIDNIDLAPDAAQKESEYILRANPGFIFTQKSALLNTALNYTMQNLFYKEDSDRNSTYHEFAGISTLSAIRDYLFLEASGSYSQQVIDPARRTNTNLLFDVGNVADTLVAQLAPYFHHEFGDVLTDLRYARGRIKYKTHTTDANQAVAGVVPVKEIDTETRSARFGSVDDLARLTWDARYEYQEATYDVAPPFRFESATLELGLLLGKSFRLIGRGGFESDPLRDTTQAGLDEHRWEAGFRWQPSLRTRLQALYGDHLYGRTYDISLRHEARRIVLAGTFTEGPTTQAQELVLRPVAQAGQQAGQTNQFGVFAPGSENFNSITTDVYFHRNIEGYATIKGQRTTVDLYVFEYRRRYVRDSSLEQTRGGSLTLTRQLGRGVDIGATGRLSDATLRAGDEYREVFYNVALNKQLSKSIRASLTGNRLRRTGNLNYTANWIMAGVNGEF